ncbi:hypothetical protein SAY87_015548 [Trapa incisa]|uniref:Uncharacterized protein n=1 Tax=Trapa incisa TaxID=236973 RepID=A0AAN7H3V0_9MYRT|nr:hypothetical protein SAY87_015548 [Trapa incisa]
MLALGVSIYIELTSAHLPCLSLEIGASHGRIAAPGDDQLLWSGREGKKRAIADDDGYTMGTATVLVLAALAAFMVLMPLVLPPLPPPPLVLLLFPVGIMATLVFLAFTPSDGSVHMDAVP